jgi:hypothetical protein
MGQYFKPCVLAENKTTVKAWVYSHDIKYTFKRADGTKVECGNGLKLMEHSYIGNEFVSAFESLIKNNPQRVIWGGDYADHCKGLKSNTYDRCTDNNKVLPTDRPNTRETRYVVNHSKREFVDKFKVKEIKDWKGAKIHPLPLLTSNGNGMGGGDFRGENKYIGTWARDIISVESRKPKGYTEIVPNFNED